MRKLRNNELDRLTVDEYKIISKTPLVVVLDNIRSCNNIGSVFRTSDALLIEKIYLCGITATPPNAEIHKTALDAEKSVTWEYFEKTDGNTSKKPKMLLHNFKIADLKFMQLNRWKTAFRYPITFLRLTKK